MPLNKETKLSGLFSVFFLIQKMLLFWWSWFILRFPNLPAFFPSLCGLFQVPQLQLVSLSPSCSSAFFFLFSRKVQVFVYILNFFNFPSVVLCDGKFHCSTNSFFLKITNSWSGLLSRISWLLVSQIPTENCASHSLLTIIIRSNFNFLHNSYWITFPQPVVSSFLLCYLTAFNYLIGWLVVSFYCLSTFIGHLMPNLFLYK